jgi:MoaA/NifB/PqqE/SkfB family radical SAM enzyme
MDDLKNNYFERLHWKVLTRCNLNCDFCYLWREPNGKTLDRTTAKKLIDEASKIFNWILLGGGDPLMHPDILDIVYYAKSKGLKVELQTNAKEINREVVPELINLIDNLGLSIDGDTQEVHDSMRKAFGNFNQQLKALEIAEKAKVYTTIRTLVTKENFESVENIPFLLSKYNCIKEWRIRQFVPLERGLKNQDRYLITDELFTKVVSACLAASTNQQTTFKISLANSKQVSNDCCIHISHDGTIYSNPISESYEAIGMFPNQSLKFLIKKMTNLALF